MTSAEPQRSTFLRHSLLILSLAVFAVAGARAQSAAEVFAALKAAANQGSLYDDGLKPWHLKLAVTLAKQDGGEETGTVEEWRNGPGQSRRVYDLPSYQYGFVEKDGVRYETPGAAAMPFALQYLLSAELYGVPRPKNLENVEPKLVETGLSSQFKCVPVGHLLPPGLPQDVETLPAYCFDAKLLRFEIVVQYHSLVTVRNQTGTFLGRTVPIRLTITSAGKPFASAQVTALQARVEPYAEAAVTDGLEKEVAVKAPVDQTGIRGGIIAGSILTKVQPVYPESAKSQHVSGPVFLHAIIGKDGRVSKLSVITSPSKDLADAALVAVRQWTYRPYLLNGAPTEVDTTVRVNFTLGRP